ncbi:hypothetical protein HMPREF1640_07180 [Prevotella sp. S7-1-8]|uniref:hypothetical protein n=1 Tax=Prevotella sp. S7-1-8 TaxID=1284775 RepID=UPI00051061A4|nr:hypothetical protein [Prevotella sp. S7-1-8]KGF17537.1 hypothetical protein HMPREF1640_07180 [Prevotella sp. S7-1-8]
MKPIDFEQSTKVLQKPGTLSDSQCGALPVWCDGKQCVSCWKPSIKERINILFGGNVWLGVMSGKTQPPVFVAGERVFEKTPFLPVLGRLGLKWVEVIAEAWKNLAEAAKMPDKRKHLYVGIVIGLVFGCLFGVSIGFAAGCLAGAIKEWWDSKGHGTVEIMDFIFTAIGALCGAFLSIPAIILYHLIIELYGKGN